jgi:DnaK suppressor protein
MDVEAVRRRLLSRREELRSRASRANADLRHEADPLSSDSAEQVTQRETDDVLGAISQSAGRYASCAVCGESIEEERLSAVPYTDRCRACAEGAASGHTRRR